MAWIWPIRSWVAATAAGLFRYWNLVALAFGHVQTHSIWFIPAPGYRCWLVVSNLDSEHLPTGLCHDQGFLLLAGRLFNFSQSHNGLVSNRNGHVCLYCWITREGSWYGKCEGSQYRHFLSSENRTLNKSRLLIYHTKPGPCAKKSPCQSDGRSLSNNEAGLGSDHASSTVWPGTYRYLDIMQGMMCWIVGAGKSFQFVMHGQP